jgi:hypothetical protein
VLTGPFPESDESSLYTQTFLIFRFMDRSEELRHCVTGPRMHCDRPCLGSRPDFDVQQTFAVPLHFGSLLSKEKSAQACWQANVRTAKSCRAFMKSSVSGVFRAIMIRCTVVIGVTTSPALLLQGDCVTFCKSLGLHDEALLASCPTPRLGDRSVSFHPYLEDVFFIHSHAVGKRIHLAPRYSCLAAKYYLVA